MTAATLAAPAVAPNADRPGVLDEHTFRAAWRALHPDIVGYMHRRAPAQHAEDLASQVFLKAWDRRATFRPGGSIRAWIYTIAGSTVADHYRAAARRPQSVGDAVPDAMLIDDDFAIDLTNLIADRALLAPAFTQLTERHQQVLALRFLQDRSIADTAAEMDLTVGAVKSLTARALEALRELLTPPVAVEPEPVVEAAPEPALEPVTAPSVPAALVAKHLTPLPLPALARQHVPSLEQPRSPHVVDPTRPRRARRARRDLRRGRPAGRRPSHQQAFRCANPPTAGRVEALAARPAFDRPDVARRAQHAAAAEAVGSPRPGSSSHGRRHTRTAGRVVSDTIAGAAVGIAVLAIVATFTYCLLTSAGSRRHTHDTLAAIDQGWNAGTRAWRIWNRPPEPVTAIQETTVRIAPRDVQAAWPQPIPQAVVDHVALHRADAGRHRVRDGVR